MTTEAQIPYKKMSCSKPKTDVNVRPYRLTVNSDSKRAATTLSQAFSEDPIMLAMYGRKSWALLSKGNFEWLLYCFAKAHKMTDVVESEKGDILAAAIWERPGISLYAIPLMVMYLFWHLYSFGWTKSKRLLYLAYELEKKKQKYAHDAYHLLVLGTDTNSQNMGIGSKIIKEGLDRADKLNIPCYLESSNIRNVPFYKRHRFKTVEVYQHFKTGVDGGEGPVFTLMRREPVKKHD